MFLTLAYIAGWLTPLAMSVAAVILFFSWITGNLKPRRTYIVVDPDTLETEERIS